MMSDHPVQHSRFYRHRIDVIFDQLDENSVGEPYDPLTGHVHYHSVEFRAIAEKHFDADDYGPHDPFELVPALFEFQSGDPAVDYEAALAVARQVEEPEEELLEELSETALAFVRDSGEFYWAPSDSHPLDLTIARIHRDPTVLALNRKLVASLPPLDDEGSAIALLTELFSIVVPDTVRGQEPGDLMAGLAFRLAHEAGMSVAAELYAIHDLARVWVPDLLAGIAEQQIGGSWEEAPVTERRALVEHWKSFPGIKTIDFVGGTRDQTPYRSFYVIPNEQFAQLTVWLREGVPG